jgi:hypothetical protein
LAVEGDAWNNIMLAVQAAVMLVALVTARQLGFDLEGSLAIVAAAILVTFGVNIELCWRAIAKASIGVPLYVPVSTLCKGMMAQLAIVSATQADKLILAGSHMAMGEIFLHERLAGSLTLATYVSVAYWPSLSVAANHSDPKARLAAHGRHLIIVSAIGIACGIITGFAIPLYHNIVSLPQPSIGVIAAWIIWVPCMTVYNGAVIAAQSSGFYGLNMLMQISLGIITISLKACLVWAGIRDEFFLVIVNACCFVTCAVVACLLIFSRLSRNRQGMSVYASTNKGPAT